MQPEGFDRLTKVVADRVSRRTVLRSGAGLGGLALGGSALAATSAQEATPAAAPGTKTMFLFVQMAERGTWLPSADDPEVYELTLTGIGSQTAYFSDRPERIVGTVDTGRFLDGLGFTPSNPPNAAAVIRTPEGERDVLVIELFDPVYTQELDADGGGALRYRAKVLDAYHGEGLTSWYEEQDDPELPSAFDQVSLFIDDCSDLTGCYTYPDIYVGPLPGGPVGQCWSWRSWYCAPDHPDCNGPSIDHFNDLCNFTYDACGDSFQGSCNAW
jgi:hypothetical protein